jgi:predicted nucleotidyltransferase component of viral defense system
MRALLQQQMKWPRPRDLYDLWFILCNKRERFDWDALYRLFLEKCRVRKIEPDKCLLTSQELRAANETVWLRQLGAVMVTVPDFATVWREWVEFSSEALPV